MSRLDATRRAAGSTPSFDEPTLEQYNASRAQAMTEIQLQTVIIATATRQGFLVYHTYDSRRSVAGYPDLHLVHATRRLSLFRELKTMTGKTTQAQQAWLLALTAAGQDASVWRPSDWFNGTISEQLDPTQQ